MHALIAILPSVDTPPTFDFDPAIALITSFSTALGVAVLAVFGVGLVVAATIWGFPKLLGLFKKTAK